MVEKKKTSRKRVMVHVSRAQAAKEAATMTNGVRRSRWITVLVVIVLLGFGAWMIGKRVSPHVFDTAQIAVEGVAGSYGGVVARNDVPMMDGDMIEPQMMAKGLSLVSAKQAVPSIEIDESSSVIDSRKVIKNGFIDIVVEDVAWTTRELRRIAQGYGGDVMTSHFMADEDEMVRGTITLRISVDQFDTVFDRIKSDIALVVRNENMTAQDVSEQFIDLEAQLKNKKREEESIAAILKKSGKLSDVLAVTRELSRVRGEIERFEGRLRYLSSRTDYATITVNIEEDEKIISPDTGWRPAVVAKQSFNRLMADAQEFVDNGIRFSVWFVPMFLVYVIIIVILWRIVRRIGGSLVQRWEKKQSDARGK